MFMKYITQKQQMALLALITMPFWASALYRLSLEVWCIAYGLIY